MTSPDNKPARVILRKPAVAPKPRPAAPAPTQPATQAAPRPSTPATRHASANTPDAPPAKVKKPRLRKPRKEVATTTSALPDTGERLSKRVMQLKGCSRKEAEQYIEGGFVLVNGTVVEEPAHRVDREVVTMAADASLLNQSPVTLLLNKPAGATDGVDEEEDDEDVDAPRRPRKGAKPSARAQLQTSNHWADDVSGIQPLKRHFRHLEADVELETGATGLVVFTQDWRITRKLTEDMAFMEHELLVEVKGELEPDALVPMQRALKDDRLNLPTAKVSINSTTPERSRLRFAIKGSHPGLVAYLCELAKLEILAMRRTRIGRVSLGDVPVGQWRYLAGYEKF